MRVTEGQRLQSAMRAVEGSERAVARAEEKVATGRSINRPSDAPAAAARSVRIVAEQRSIEAATYTAGLVRGELDASDQALQELSSVLARGHELGIAGASETLTASDRVAISLEVNGLVEAALSLANTSLDGRHLFGGAATAAPPYSIDGSGASDVAIYGGSDVPRDTPVGLASVRTGPPGPGPFAGPAGALDGLLALRDALIANDTMGVRDAVGRVDEALEGTTAALAALGTERSDLDALDEGLAARGVQLEALRSAVQDVDLSRAIIELRERQASLDRGLAVVARALQTSIFDYLR